MKYDTRTGGTGGTGSPGGEVAPSQPSRRTPITPDMELKAERILAEQLNGFVGDATVIAAAAIYLGKRLRSLDFF